jgi:putative restriction endonuclease
LNAISGEKTLPVLEAAHIKPYSKEGPHSTSNGLLLRKDLHTLFDRGYITIDEKLHVEVSKRIGNGREYYAFHGRTLAEVPKNIRELPSIQFIRGHNENVFLA